VQRTASGYQDMIGGLGRSWGWVLFFGLVTALMGLVAILWPGKTLVVVAVVFGIQLVINGIFRLVATLAIPGESGGARVLIALLGILSIIVGLWAIRNVLITLVSLTLFLGVYWIVHGLIEMFEAISRSDLPARGMHILAGLVGTIAGIIVLMMPGTSITALTWVLGFWLLVYGIFEIVVAFQLRGARASSAATNRPAEA
jgi:uncharacterized membrane protein HdeD (DUF308 family)